MKIGTQHATYFTNFKQPHIVFKGTNTKTVVTIHKEFPLCIKQYN